MNTTRIKALFKKEITNVLRDKKTLIIMIAVPILMYPIMLVAMSLGISMVSTDGGDIYKIAFVDMPAKSAQAVETIIKEENEDTSLEFQTLKAQPAMEELNSETVQAVLAETGENHYIVHYLSAKNKSGKAADMIFDALEIYLEDMRIEEVEKRGLDRQEILQPISFEEKDHSSTEETIGNLIGGFIPMLMIMSILMGAIFPAIDVTAGEKERGTLETLITMPVTNFEMIMSKFLAVSIVSCVSALLNIIGMALTFGYMGSLMSEEMGIAGLNLVTFLPAVLVTVVVIVFFALFVTAVCLFVSLFAKSYKEANNYFTPVMLVFIFLSYTGMLTDLQLTGATAGIPVINFTLMVKQLFQLNYDYPLFGIVLVSNAAYSFLMMWLLAKVYNSETVLFGEGFSSVKLFDKRSDMKKGQMPGYGDIVLLVCGVFLLMFYVGNAIQTKLGLGGMAVTQAIILVVPLLYAWYLKTDRNRLFSLRPPRIRHLAGAVVLWAGVICAVMVLILFLARLMPESLEAVNETFSFVLDSNVVVLWLVIALMPAVGEELLFRGFVFGTLKEKGKLITAMLITSAIFGLFHMSLIKFFSTFILGLFIVLAVQRSGSIFTGMLIHMINNTYSVLSMKYPEILEKVPLIGLEKPTVFQCMLLLLTGAFGITAGFLIMGKENEKDQNNSM